MCLATRGKDSPLQLVRPWVLTLPVRAERTKVPRRMVNQAMPDQLALPVESFSSFSAGTALYKTAIGTRLPMDVSAGVHDMFSLRRGRFASLSRIRVLVGFGLAVV